MDVLDNRLFIPKGLHLMEGKDVVSKLLAEHKKFLSNSNSIQVEGISLDDMNRYSVDRQNTLKEYLLDIPAVCWQSKELFSPQTEDSGYW